MGRRRKAANEIQGHRTKAELAGRVEADLIAAIPDHFPPTSPGWAPLPPLGTANGALDKRKILRFLEIRKLLIDGGLLCVGDNALILACIAAESAGFQNYHAAINEYLESRPRYIFPALPPPPREPRKPEIRPEFDDGVVECTDNSECVPGNRICPLCREVAQMVRDDDAEDVRLYPERFAAYEKEMAEWRKQCAAIKSLPLVQRD